MITSIAIQEIHDTLRAPKTDWQAMYLLSVAGRADLAQQIHELTRQRDMLARRCAEQANHIAGLISLQAQESAEADPIHNAIAAMQKAGIP